jgi:hypothetical protein
MAHFQGYYFRHQNQDKTVAVIAGKADDGAFIQVITDENSRVFCFPDGTFGKTARIGENYFAGDGIRLSLPDIKGEIRYTDLTPLRSDIMGFFRFFPMECRHEIVSMRHRLNGTLEIDGKPYCFDGGIGYWEGDRGISFPKEYLWMQANDFEDGSSWMLSVARVPFAGMAFKGVICAVMVGGKEYRLATYFGAKAKITDRLITVRQGSLLLQAEILSRGEGHELSAPKLGKMSGMIREDNSAQIRMTLQKRGHLICDLTSSRAALEQYP